MSANLKSRRVHSVSKSKIARVAAEQVQVLEKRVLFSAFAANDLAVVVAAASASNTTASVIEVSPTSTTPTTPVQTISIPGTGTNAVRISGSATSTVYVSDTNDGKYLAFTGANSTDTASNVNTLLTRAVVALDNSGAISLATTYTGISTNQARGASSPDDATWYIGDQGGIYTNGSTAPSPTGNFRSVKSFGGTEYALTSSASAAPVDIISAASGGTATPLPGLPNGTTNIQDFYLVASGTNGATYDQLYVLSATSSTAGTIAKYSLVSGTWTANGTFSTGVGGFGLAASTSAGVTNLYLTTGTGASTANSLDKFVDTAGFNATINITAPKVVLYTAPTGQIIKGVAFAPVLLAPTISNISPVGGSTTGGTVVTINGSNFTSSSTVSIDGGTTNLPITYVSSSQITFTTPAHSAGSVNVTVTNATGTSGGTAFTYGSAQTTIGSFTVTPSAAGIGQSINFNASNVSPPAGGSSIASVSFYSEATLGSVSSSDLLLGTVATGSGGVYALNYIPNNPGTGGAALAAGSYDIYAIANSTSGSLSVASTAQPLTISVPQVAFSASTFIFSATGGAQTIPVVRSGDLADAVTVNYSISDGTAVNGINYTAAATGSLSFAAGSATPTTPLTVTFNNSATQIGNVTFSLALTSATPSTLNTVLGTSATVYIQQAARAFTAGDVAVYQVGDGSTTLTASGNQVYIAEYNSSGGLVQDFALPTYATGTATSEGGLSISADGHKLIVPGYVSTTSASLPGSSVNRDVDIVSSTGSIDSSTIVPANDFSSNNIRSATSDNGTNIWIGTAANGVRYTTDGTTTSSKSISTTLSNIRSVEVINGQLYESVGAGTSRGIATVGSGLPVTGGQTATVLPGVLSTTSSPYAYALVHLSGPGTSPDTLYIADDSQGIQKYALVSGTWTLQGTIGSGANGFRGVTASVNAGVATLYATSATGLYLFTDTAGSAAAPSSTDASTPLVTAGTNIAFRGVAFTPTAVAPPTLTSIDTTTGPTGGGTTVTITGTNFTPYSTVSFGSSPATVTYVSPTQLLATSPLVYSGGAVNISVTTVDGTTSSASFTYTQPTWLASNSAASYNPTTHVLLINGTATIIADPGTAEPITTVTAGNLIVNPSTNMVHLGSLNLSTGSTASLPTNAPAPIIAIIAADNGLAIDASSSLDLGNNYLDLQSTSQSVAVTTLQSITQSVGIGYNDGAWNGKGIFSSTASGDATHLTALGVMENSTDNGVTALYSAAAGTLGHFDGTYPAATDVLVRYTYVGDANLTGKTDGSDYSLIDSAYHTAATGWFNGDFNYDNTIDGSDYTLLDNAYNTQGTAFTSAQVATPAAMIATGKGATAAASTPIVSVNSIASAFSNKKVKPSLIHQVLQDLVTNK